MTLLKGKKYFRNIFSHDALYVIRFSTKKKKTNLSTLRGGSEKNHETKK